MELFPHFVGFCVLVVLLSLLSSAQKQQLSKSRDWIFPRQMMPSSSPQLPALAQDAFQRWHCPNLLSADVAVTPLHSRARTGTPCRARIGKVPFPAQRRKHWARCIPTYPLEILQCFHPLLAGEKQSENPVYLLPTTMCVWILSQGTTM